MGLGVSEGQGELPLLGGGVDHQRVHFVLGVYGIFEHGKIVLIHVLGVFVLHVGRVTSQRMLNMRILQHFIIQSLEVTAKLLKKGQLVHFEL